jgi:putative ABC transport system permease protein
LEEAERAQDAVHRTCSPSSPRISLVVGGIGIMNIMLATVTERTREIGIRRALGAKRTGHRRRSSWWRRWCRRRWAGCAGVMVGLAAAFGVPPLGRLFGANWPAAPSLFPVLLSLGVSIFVGVAFGLYPAWRAARLDPIEALRHT